MIIAALLFACTPETDTADAVDTDDTDAAVDDWVDPFAGHPLMDPNAYYNIAHRGGIGGPEETLEAFAAALAAGADVLEMDVWSTTDGVLYVMHDDTVDRTTDGTGAGNAMTWDELQALDAGHTYTIDDGATYPFRGQSIRVPSLEEVLTAYPDELFSLEIKQTSPSIVQPLYDVLVATNTLNQVTVGSFEDTPLKQFRELAPEVPTSMSVLEGFNFYYMDEANEEAYEMEAPILAAPLDYTGIELTDDLVARAFRVHLDLHVWTINDQDEMEMLLDWGVQSIITDDVALFDAVLADRGLR
jgi:glycerophosphoryl diester phosphodiesterase